MGGCGVWGCRIMGCRIKEGILLKDVCDFGQG